MQKVLLISAFFAVSLCAMETDAHKLQQLLVRNKGTVNNKECYTFVASNFKFRDKYMRACGITVTELSNLSSDHPKQQCLMNKYRALNRAVAGLQS
jgi:hypothetical protein